MTATAQILLFLSSYAPLFGVFALLDSFGKGWPTAVCVVLAGFGLVIPIVVLAIARHRLLPQPLKVATAQIRDGDALAYVATYLVPFAAINISTARERGALGLFVLLLAVLYVRDELFYVNPLLTVAGYRLFQVVTPTGASVVLISGRHFLAANTEVPARRLGDYVYWEA
jgi:hypothetical protein